MREPINTFIKYDAVYNIMEEQLPPVINIEASLVNVQRGDVMVIRMPENLKEGEYNRISKIIRDMLVTQGIKIPVLVLPFKWDIMMVEKDEIKEQECVDCHEMMIPIEMFPVCDLMDDPEHFACGDECNPEELTIDEVDDYDDFDDTFFRCSNCGTLNGVND